MNPQLIAIVAGNKDWLDRKSVYDALDALKPDLLVHGSLGHSVALAKKGTDQFATEWAQKRGVAYVVTPPLWDFHGKSAGAIRNKLAIWVGESLAAASGAKLVVAAMPGVSRAGDGLIALAKAKNIRVVEHDFDGSLRSPRAHSGGDQTGGGSWNR